MVTTVSNPDQGAFSYVVTPNGDGTTKVTFLVDSSSRIKQGFEYIGITVNIAEDVFQNQVLSGLKFEELIKTKRGEIMEAIVSANDNLPAAYSKLNSVLSGVGHVADIAPIALDLATGQIDLRYRSGQIELGVEIANVVLGVAAGTTTRYAVLGSIAIGAAVGGPVGAGIGLLVGLTAAAGGNVLMIAKQDEIKSFLRRQLEWAYGEAFSGVGATGNWGAPPARTDQSEGPNPNLLESFTQDIVVTAKRLAQSGGAISNRFLLADPAQVRQDSTLRQSLVDASQGGGSLGAFMNGSTGSVITPGVTGMIVSAVPGAVVSTVARDGASFTVSVDPASLPTDPALATDAIVRLLESRGKDALNVDIIPTANYGEYSIGGSVGAILGSSLGNFVGNGNILSGTLAGSVLGTIGQNIGQAIVVGGFNRSESV